MPAKIVRRTFITVSHKTNDAGKRVKVTKKVHTHPRLLVSTAVRREIRNGKRVKITTRRYKKAEASA